MPLTQLAKHNKKEMIIKILFLCRHCEVYTQLSSSASQTWQNKTSGKLFKETKPWLKGDRGFKITFSLIIRYSQVRPSTSISLLWHDLWHTLVRSPLLAFIKRRPFSLSCTFFSFNSWLEWVVDHSTQTWTGTGQQGRSEYHGNKDTLARQECSEGWEGQWWATDIQ